MNDEGRPEETTHATHLDGSTASVSRLAFADFEPGLPGPARLDAFGHLPESEQNAYWRGLAEEARADWDGWDDAA